MLDRLGKRLIAHFNLPLASEIACHKNVALSDDKVMRCVEISWYPNCAFFASFASFFSASLLVSSSSTFTGTCFSVFFVFFSLGSSSQS